MLTKVSQLYIMYKYVKRILDIAVSFMGLVLLVPVFIVLAIWIKLESRGPVFFRQKRYGKDKVPFNCLKFRTMTIADSVGVATRDLKNAGDLITFSGRINRRLGIDELPQLFNVLKGEMSLIGPRPVVLSEKNLIAERDKYGANAMIPGIGGWAQSNGRDELDDKTKARLDGEYAQNFGWRMDFSCLWRTAVAIFTSDGFKEGHFGDDTYRKKVKKNTKKLSLPRRVYNKIARKNALRQDKKRLVQQPKDI